MLHGTTSASPSRARVAQSGSFRRGSSIRPASIASSAIVEVLDMIVNSKHQVVDEQPEIVTELIERYASR
jgi:hypothetical protein